MSIIVKGETKPLVLGDDKGWFVGTLAVEYRDGDLRGATVHKALSEHFADMDEAITKLKEVQDDLRRRDS